MTALLVVGIPVLWYCAVSAVRSGSAVSVEEGSTVGVAIVCGVVGLHCHIAVSSANNPAFVAGSRFTVMSLMKHKNNTGDLADIAAAAVSEGETSADIEVRCKTASLLSSIKLSKDLINESNNALLALISVPEGPIKEQKLRDISTKLQLGVKRQAECEAELEELQKKKK